MVWVALLLFYIATLLRTLAWFWAGNQNRPQFPLVVGLEAVFLILYVLVLWLPRMPSALFHSYLALQSASALAVFIQVSDLDFTTAFYLLLSCQVALRLRGRVRQAWILALALLTICPGLFFANPLRNLALQLSTMAGIIVLAAYIAATQEEESARAQSQQMLAELQVSHARLEEYARQVEDLAALEERNRLARELHDSVSQTMFSVILNVRAAQMLLKRDPSRLRPQLERLQSLTQSALGEMRRLISQLRPK